MGTSLHKKVKNKRVGAVSYTIASFDSNFYAGLFSSFKPF